MTPILKLSSITHPHVVPNWYWCFKVNGVQSFSNTWTLKLHDDWYLFFCELFF